MPDFQKIEDFLAHFKQLLASRYRPVSGGVFSAVLALHNQQWFLAAGRALFLDAAPEARPVVKYRAIRLLEEWVPGQERAYDRLVALLSASGTIAGESMPTFGFDYTRQEHWAWRGKNTGWPEAFFQSIPAMPSVNRPSITNDPVTEFGLAPYENGAHVVHEWMYGERGRTSSSGLSNVGVFSTLLPDTRARIVSAIWRKEQLEVHVEVNVPRERLELQCIFSESAQRRGAVVRGPADQVSIPAPSDAQSIMMYLVHSTGDLLDRVAVSRLDRVFDETARDSRPEDQVAADIQGGENDEVEFKPFIRPAADKENEIIETVVAFANTRGGRLYLGVDDHRRVEGRSALCRAMEAKEDAARMDLERLVGKLLTNKVKPVPKLAMSFVEYAGEPVFVVNVQRGDQRPYATFNNQIYIRKGSSNVNPDPTTELPHLFSRPTGMGIDPPLLGLGTFRT